MKSIPGTDHGRSEHFRREIFLIRQGEPTRDKKDHPFERKLQGKNGNLLPLEGGRGVPPADKNLKRKKGKEVI